MSTMNIYQGNFEKIQKGFDWLKKNIEHDKEKISHEIKEIKERHGNSFLMHSNIKLLEMKLKIKYDPLDIVSIYALSFLDGKIVDEFRKCAENEEVFWNDVFIASLHPSEEFYYWNFFYEMGFSSNRQFLNYFNEIKKETTEDGRFWNEDSHVCFLRLAIDLEQQSSITNRVLKYGLQNNYHLLEPFESSVFVLALTELDCSKYKEIIEEGIRFIKSKQNEDGSWGEREVYRDTYFAIRSICRINGSNDEQLKKGLNFILNKQQPDGSWGVFINEFDKDIYYPNKEYTSFALLILQITSPPFSISLEEYMFKKSLLKQKINLHKPYFVHTSPIYIKNIHVKEIYKKIREGFNNANYTIRIISPYIDMLYEDIIDLKNKNPTLNIKIITRPKKDIKGMRERIAKNVLDLLETATGGNLKTLDVIHSRLIIIDDQELIISSADMTREGLYDEFNAGIYTRDKETVKNCIDYFENIWKIIKEKEEY